MGLLHEALAAGAHLLLEGAQATFLDLDHGTYPYVTSSNPTAEAPAPVPRLRPRDVDRVVGITKAYTTRVGAGPFPTEPPTPMVTPWSTSAASSARVTGRRRRAGWLDCVMLRHAVRLNSLTELALTKLDVLDGFATVKVCTGYRLDGAELEHYPDRSDMVARVEPVYCTLPGWGTTLSGARTRADLPPARPRPHRPRRTGGRDPGRRRRCRGGARRPSAVASMIERYSLPEMAAVWADTTRMGRWLEIELLATEAHAELGVLPIAAAKECRERAPVVDDAFVAAVAERERTTDHDVAAFVDVVQARIGSPAAAWIHYGLTSSDVVDTALCWAMRDAVDLLLSATDDLLRTLVPLARAHIGTTMIGRTHGIHAEPTTFGAKVALWALQVDRDRSRLRAAREVVGVAKLSGAVGTYSNVDPAVEAHVGAALGLRPVPATQVIARDRHAEFLWACAAVAATCETVAVELRHLQRTEVGRSP